MILEDSLELVPGHVYNIQNIKGMTKMDDFLDPFTCGECAFKGRRGTLSPSGDRTTTGRSPAIPPDWIGTMQK